MNSALIYRPNSRKLIATSFICAIGIHLTAVVVAENKSNRVLPSSAPVSDEVVGVDIPASAPELDDASVPEQPVVTEQEFYDEKLTAAVRPRKKVPVAPIRSNSIGMTAGIRGGLATARALYAPRPTYPYEARRSGTTGSGVAQLIVDSAAGNVLEARMAQTTGSPILDNATLSAFRRWRFKPGVASNIDVPITYTLTGVSY
jgi:TonB family protein